MFAQTQFEMGSARASRAANDALVVGFAVRATKTNCSGFANGLLATRSVRRGGASNRSRGRLRSPVYHVGKPREIKPSLREFEALLAHEEKVNA